MRVVVSSRAPTSTSTPASPYRVEDYITEVPLSIPVTSVIAVIALKSHCAWWDGWGPVTNWHLRGNKTYDKACLTDLSGQTDMLNLLGPEKLNPTVIPSQLSLINTGISLRKKGTKKLLCKNYYSLRNILISLQSILTRSSEKYRGIQSHLLYFEQVIPEEQYALQEVTPAFWYSSLKSKITSSIGAVCGNRQYS